MGVRAPLGALPRCCAAVCESALTRCEASIRSGPRGGQDFCESALFGRSRRVLVEVRLAESASARGIGTEPRAGGASASRRCRRVISGTWNHPRLVETRRSREPEPLPRAGGDAGRSPARGTALGSWKPHETTCRSGFREPEMCELAVRRDLERRRTVPAHARHGSGTRNDLRHAEIRQDCEPETIARAGSARGSSGTRNHPRHGETRGNDEPEPTWRAGGASAATPARRITSGTRKPAETASRSRPGEPQVTPEQLRLATSPPARGERADLRAGVDLASRRWPGASRARGITFGTRKPGGTASRRSSCEPEAAPGSEAARARLLT